MSVVAWLIAVVLRAGRSPRPAVYWIAIIVSAVLFGAGHLPAAAALVPLSGAIAARIVVLNAIAGVASGWLYWRSGLEAAMIAHFASDLVLHVIA